MQPTESVKWKTTVSLYSNRNKSSSVIDATNYAERPSNVIEIASYTHKDKDETSVYHRKQQMINDLGDIYNLEDVKSIGQFLWSHEALIDILYEAHRYIKNIFDPNIADICLELYQDYEEDYEGLSVTIKTNLSPEKSLDLLDEFDEKWWLDIDCSFLSVMVRPV
jgi:hypothetical protein